jgi:hypothetical protein
MRTCVLIVVAITAASCSTLDHVHDPQYGLLGNPPNLLKSIRCELITFYAANAARKKALDRIRNDLRHRGVFTIDMEMVLANRYFDLDTDAYGAFVLETKTVDSVGFPGTSTAITDVISSTTNHTKSLTTSPNLGSQGTYDMNYNFVIQQDDQISNVEAAITEDQITRFETIPLRDNSTQCFRAVVIGKYDEMAEGKYPTLERFHRITVNFGLPLAAWLQQNTTIMGVSRNILADDVPPKDAAGKPLKSVKVPQIYMNEGVDGGQMSYLFTVQYTTGVDAKFSLVSPAWNPLNADLSASMVQTGVLSLYVNGYLAAAALGAKSGIVGIVGRAPPPGPQQVLVVNGYPVKPPEGGPPPTNYPPVKTTPATPEEAQPPGHEKNAPAVRPQRNEQQTLPPATRGPNRGQFFGPATPFLLTPGP